jgi:hypothetical protein
MTNCIRSRKPPTVPGEDLYKVLGDKLMSPKFKRVAEVEVEEGDLLFSVSNFDEMSRRITESGVKGMGFGNSMICGVGRVPDKSWSSPKRVPVKSRPGARWVPVKS